MNKKWIMACSMTQLLVRPMMNWRCLVSTISPIIMGRFKTTYKIVFNQIQWSQSMRIMTNHWRHKTSLSKLIPDRKSKKCLLTILRCRCLSFLKPWIYQTCSLRVRRVPDTSNSLRICLSTDMSNRPRREKGCRLTSTNAWSAWRTSSPTPRSASSAATTSSTKGAPTSGSKPKRGAPSATASKRFRESYNPNIIFADCMEGIANTNSQIFNRNFLKTL